MSQVTTRVAGLYVIWAVPWPAVWTGGTWSLPLSGTVKDNGFACASPLQAVPASSVAKIRERREIAVCMFASRMNCGHWKSRRIIRYCEILRLWRCVPPEHCRVSRRAPSARSRTVRRTGEGLRSLTKPAAWSLGNSAVPPYGAASRAVAGARQTAPRPPEPWRRTTAAAPPSDRPGSRNRRQESDARLVRGAAEKSRHEKALEQDLSGDRRPSIGVDDADDLVHARPLVHVFRLQRRTGEALVDIAHDRLRLVEVKAVMLESRHFGEGVARQMRLLAMLAERHLDEIVGDPLFRERHPRAPHIGAAGRTIDDRACHRRALLRYRFTRQTVRRRRGRRFRP